MNTTTRPRGSAWAIAGMLAMVGCSSKRNNATVADPGIPGTEAQPTQVGVFAPPAGAAAQYPTRVAVTTDAVYVSDAQGQQVIGYQTAGQPTLLLQQLSSPLGLAVAGDLLYVGNSGRQDVEIYSIAGQKFLRTLGRPGDFLQPNAIAVAGDGMVYVADSKKDKILVFDAAGVAQPPIGGRGQGDGQFIFPVAVAVQADRVVVGDQGNHRIQVFDRKGKFVRAFGGQVPSNARAQGDFAGRFSRIQGLALSGTDIYVLDSYHSHVQVFDGQGHCQGFFGRTTDFALALDLALLRPGVVAVTDPEQRRWVELSTTLGWTP